MLLTCVLVIKTTRQAAVSAAWIHIVLPLPSPGPPVTQAFPGLSARSFFFFFFFSPQPLFNGEGEKKRTPYCGVVQQESYKCSSGEMDAPQLELAWGLCN